MVYYIYLKLNIMITPIISIYINFTVYFYRLLFFFFKKFNDEKNDETKMESKNKIKLKMFVFIFIIIIITEE